MLKSAPQRALFFGYGCCRAFSILIAMLKKLWICLFYFTLGQAHAQQVDLQFCATPTVHYKKIELLFCNIPASAGFSYGICWNQSPMPTLYNSFRIFTPTAEEFRFDVKDLNPNTDYYFRLFKLYDDGSAEYFTDFVSSTLPEIQIGSYYQGGIVAYIFKPKDSLYVPGEQHGIIIAIEDLGYATWGMFGDTIAGGTNIRIGYGQKNTESIVNQYKKRNGNVLNMPISHNTEGHIANVIHPCAALMCHQYEHDKYTDWFLPSLGDWQSIFGNMDSLKMINLNNTEHHWTSSEVEISWRFRKNRTRHTKSRFRSAWAIKIHSPGLFTSTFFRKKSTARVRAMRYF